MSQLSSGRIVRLRNFRDYDLDGKSWIEWSCEQKGEKKDEKQVFTLLLLATAPLVMAEDVTPAEYQADIDALLRSLGYMTIDEAVAAGADPKKFSFEIVANGPSGASE